MDFKWQNVTVNVINKNANYAGKYRKLVDCSSGQVRTGELLAIMGPSGGGKTTLMNTLAGRVPSGSKTSGVITFDGKTREHNPKKWLSMVGFVDQDDTVFEKLTVEETVYYAAKFRTKYKSDDDIRLRVDDMLKAFQIQNISKNQMGKISGGERKRTMIAIELIADPDIIFLDEPTSGLDSPKAKVIIDILKKLARERNKLIILTIHQPSAEIFSVFDKLILLNDGRTVYNGLANDCEAKVVSMGASRRDTQSFPEFLVEFVSTNLSYAESTQYGSVIRELEKEYHTGERAENRGKETKSNSCYIDYTTKPTHIFTLLSRRYRLESRTFVKILKSAGAKIIFMLVLIPIIAYQFKTKANFKNNAFATKVNLSAAQKEAADNVVNNVIKHIGLYRLSYILTVISEVSMVALSFFEENPQIRREIGVGTCSPMSYYLAIFLYNLINCMVINTVGFVIICGLVYKMIIPPFYKGLLYFTLPFFTVAFGMFIGTITNKKRFLTYVAPMIGLLSAMSSHMLYVILQVAKVSIYPSSFDYTVLSYVLAFIPTYPINIIYETYGLALSNRHAQKELLKIDKFETPAMHHISDSRKNDIINMLHFTLCLKWMLAFLPTIAVILFSFYFIGRLKMPSLRLKLQ